MRSDQMDDRDAVALSVFQPIRPERADHRGCRYDVMKGLCESRHFPGVAVDFEEHEVRLAAARHFERIPGPFGKIDHAADVWHPGQRSTEFVFERGIGADYQNAERLLDGALLLPFGRLRHRISGPTRGRAPARSWREQMSRSRPGWSSDFFPALR